MRTKKQRSGEGYWGPRLKEDSVRGRRYGVCDWVSSLSSAASPQQIGLLLRMIHSHRGHRPRPSVPFEYEHHDCECWKDEQYQGRGERFYTWQGAAAFTLDQQAFWRELRKQVVPAKHRGTVLKFPAK